MKESSFSFSLYMCHFSGVTTGFEKKDDSVSNNDVKKTSAGGGGKADDDQFSMDI